MRPPLSALDTKPFSPWLGWLLLGLLLVAVQVVRPLLPVDETRYVSVAWEMWTRGDFLVPFKNGVPYSHKPPVLMWSMQLGWAVFGVNEWWPRSVAFLYSGGALVMLRLLALRLWPGEKGLANAAAYVLATLLWWMLFSTATMFDVLLSFWVVLAMWATMVATTSPRKGFIWLGLAMGAGVLTKGPVMLLHVLPLALLMPWWRPGTPWKPWLGGVLAALVLAVMVVLAWAIPAGISGGEAYQQAIFWGQTANRMVQSFAHRHPAWWYLPWVPLMLSPWLLWPAVWRGWWQLRKGPVDHGVRFCLAWAVPVFLAFCFISGKQPHYLMPLLPAVALLVARGLHQPTTIVGRLWLPALLVALTGAAALLIALGVVSIGSSAQTIPAWPGVAILLGAIVAMAWSWRAPQARAPMALGIMGWWTVINLLILVGPVLTERHDMRPIAQRVHALQSQGYKVAHQGAYHGQLHFLGRLTQALDIIDERPGRTVPWLKAHPDVLALMFIKHPEDLQGTEPLLRHPYRGRIAVILPPNEALMVAQRLAKRGEKTSAEEPPGDEE